MNNTTDIAECGFDGNSDIYGMGVRFGIYLQWATSIIAEHLHEPAIQSTRGANTTYQLAMLAGLILITTARDAETKAIEGYITLFLCFASAWIASLQSSSAARSAFDRARGFWGSGGGGEDDGGGDQRYTRGSGIDGRGGDLLLGTATCAYGIWFLFIGLDRLPRTDCPEIVFFFSKADPFGWFRVLSKVAFIASVTGSAVLIPLHVSLLAQDMTEHISQWGARHLVDHPGNSAEIVRIVYLRPLKLFGSVVVIGTFVAAVELTLVWNHIRDVHTCDTFSQLFPLMVGATNFVRVCYELAASVTFGDSRIRKSR
ncbi:hypothetical protein B0T16DRAFT_516257 [Cercophora newfieldiana]|uniref:Uncharacterized protein n=1 Tax=Cercophora newfieldiana TaxID=92897 RepID=A0AA40CK15_9PEZI|nr:hypothetical protein B0T16DRAFT_516257 [Cercophora newfieldiana]